MKLKTQIYCTKCNCPVTKNILDHWREKHGHLMYRGGILPKKWHPSGGIYTGDVFRK